MGQSEARPRQWPLVNPEHATAMLRALVTAWDGDDQVRFLSLLLRARELLHLEDPHLKDPAQEGAR